MNTNNFIKRFRKITILLVSGLLILTLTSLHNNDVQNKNSANSEPFEVSISGNISGTVYVPLQSGSVTFNRFPATVEEFNQAREKIGDKPHGAVALQIMAYEMFRRDRAVGEECIMLNNISSNTRSPIGRLKELFGNDANYARPYQMAAFLKGATPKNGYNPSKPYKIEVRVSKTQKFLYSDIFQTNVLYLQVLTQGKSTGAETVAVLKTHKPDEPSNGEYFIVQSSPGLYSSVQAVSFTAPFKGLD